jgi:Protein of unknown function (DUF3592)
MRPSVTKKAGTLILALALLATLAAGYYGWRYWQLVSDGTGTPALSVQVDRTLMTGKDMTGLPYRYSASYTFSDQRGKVYTARQAIDRSTYEKLAQSAADAPVVIYYSRSNPDLNAINKHASRNVAIILGFIALLGWGVVLVRRMSA